jgi:hypothetical protein
LFFASACRIGSAIVGGFYEQEETVQEEHGGQHTPRAADSNIAFEQGQPRCIPTLFANLTFMLYLILVHVSNRSRLKP